MYLHLLYLVSEQQKDIQTCSSYLELNWLINIFTVVTTNISENIQQHKYQMVLVLQHYSLF